MPDLTDAELDRLVERLEAVETCITGEAFPDGTCENDRYLAEYAATAITALRARIAELEKDRAEWVEVERLRMGKV